MADPDDEKGGSQVVPGKPGAQAPPPKKDDHEQEREGSEKPSADKDHPDSF